MRLLHSPQRQNSFMKLNFLHFADYAFLTDMGKIGIVGIFDRVGSKEFPTTQQTMFVVGQVGNIGNEQELLLSITKGKEKVLDNLVVGNIAQAASPMKTYNFLININNLLFPEPGTYDFVVNSDGKEIGAAPLIVEKTAMG